MSNTVTIVGRIATTYLDRGEAVTVERTERIDRLIENGYVAISGDDSLVGAAYPAETSEAVVEATSGPDDGDDALEAPGRNASRAEWVEFVTAQGFDVTEDQTRDDLVEAWHG